MVGSSEGLGFDLRLMLAGSDFVIYWCRIGALCVYYSFLKESLYRFLIEDCVGGVDGRGTS